MQKKISKDHKESVFSNLDHLFKMFEGLTDSEAEKEEDQRPLLSVKWSNFHWRDVRPVCFLKKTRNFSLSVLFVQIFSG